MASLPPTLLASRARDTGRGRGEIASTIFKGRVLAISLRPLPVPPPRAAARAARHQISPLRFVSVDSVAPFVSVLQPSVPSSIPDYNFRRMKHFR